jgi:hypothetical protein
MGWEGDGWTAPAPFGRRLDRPKGVHDGWTAMDKLGDNRRTAGLSPEAPLEDGWTASIFPRVRPLVEFLSGFELRAN